MLLRPSTPISRSLCRPPVPSRRRQRAFPASPALCWSQLWQVGRVMLSRVVRRFDARLARYVLKHLCHACQRAHLHRSLLPFVRHTCILTPRARQLDRQRRWPLSSDVTPPSHASPCDRSSLLRARRSSQRPLQPARRPNELVSAARRCSNELAALRPIGSTVLSPAPDAYTEAVRCVELLHANVAHFVWVRTIGSLCIRSSPRRL
ncbi:hypothetical protein C8R45DRAFT_262943 [Mycena sanguinolenta]|nr:hypothetical protein C8R45DRAFT_262943 [Mycena sanguinolenta]